MQVIPGTILALILFLVFGEGSIVPIVLISAVIFPLFVNQTFSSLNKIPKERIEACQLFGGDRIDLLRYVYFPELYPNLKNTGITAIGLASKIVVLGEFIGSSNGIGFGLNNAKTFYKMDEVFGYLLIIIILNLVLQLTFFAFLKLLDNLLTK
jgi:NitT/TauT family transport system permease protein